MATTLRTKIMMFLDKHPRQTTTAIATMVGASGVQIEDEMARMVDCGLVSRFKTRLGLAVWEMVPNWRGDESGDDESGSAGSGGMTLDMAPPVKIGTAMERRIADYLERNAPSGPPEVLPASLDSVSVDKLGEWRARRDEAAKSLPARAEKNGVSELTQAAYDRFMGGIDAAHEEVKARKVKSGNGGAR